MVVLDVLVMVSRYEIDIPCCVGMRSPVTLTTSRADVLSRCLGSMASKNCIPEMLSLLANYIIGAASK